MELVVVVVVVALLELLALLLLDDDEVVEVDTDVTVLETKAAVIETVPELAAFRGSPGYAACIVTAPGVAPIIDIPQTPPELRLHVAGEVMLTLPVSPDC